jgi:geranyl-CoA carboxylase alpha subunit
VEFLLDAAGNFYFLEMNTRLQVEHAVTGAITGIDMVEWQLRIAAGEPLPLTQGDVQFRGHAIEARLYAEDPYADFLPQSGNVIDWRPATGEGVRIDHSLARGQTVTPFYDPLLAKVIASGTTRQEARRRLIAALEDTIVFGPTTNRGFLLAILRHAAFATGETTTAFIERYFAADSDAACAPQPDQPILVIAAALLFESRGRSDATAPAAAWSSTGVAIWPLRLTIGETNYSAHIMALKPDRYLVALNDEMVEVSIDRREADTVRFTVFGLQQSAHFAVHDGVLYLGLHGVTIAARDTTLEMSRAQRGSDAATLLAPMNGAIIAVDVKAGDRVARGQRLVVLEAMKMQHEIRAQRDGVVGKVLVETGQQVATRQLLVELEPQAQTAEERKERSVS